MRNLKKVLTLVLTVAMLLSIMVVGTGAAFSDQSTIKNTEAVDACSALNIIAGMEDGSYRPANNVTRAQMCKMICVALNGGKEPTLGTNNTPTFNDVRTDASSKWAESFIESCYTQGIVSGVGNGRFNPSGSVTGTQAARMLLVALGYRADLAGFTGDSWAINVNTAASAKGLYAGIESIDANAALSRDNAAQMIWNALNAYEVEYVSQLITDKDGKLVSSLVPQDKVVGKTDDKITMLEDKYEAKAITGTLAYVRQDNGKSTYSIKIDNAKYNGETWNNGSDTFTDVNGNYSDLLYQNVRVLVKTDKNGKDAVVYGVYATTKNTVKSGILADLKTDGTTRVKLDGTKYDLAKDNAVYVNGDKAMKDSKNAYTIYEWVQVFGDGSGSKYTNAAYMQPTAVKLLATDGTSDYDTLQVTTYAVGKVTSVGSDYVNVSFKKGDSSILSKAKCEDSDWNWYSGISKNDYVLVTDAGNYADNKGLLEKADVISGKVTGTKGTDKFTIDGTQYTMAGKGATLDKAPKLNAKVDVVSIGGYVYYTDTQSGAIEDVALLVETASSGGVGSKMEARLIFADGKDQVVPINKYWEDKDNKNHVIGTITEKDGGILVSYEKSGDTYTLTKLGSLKTYEDTSELATAGYDAYISVGAAKTDGSIKNGTFSGKDSANSSVGTVNRLYYDENATVFVKYNGTADGGKYDDASYRVVTGKTASGYDRNLLAAAALADKSGNSFYGKAVFLDMSASRNTGGSSEKHYAVALGGVSKDSSSGSTLYTVTGWNGTEEILFKSEDSFSVDAGDIFEYSTASNDLYDIDTVVNDEYYVQQYDAGSGDITLYTVTNTGVPGAVVTDDTVGNINKTKIDSKDTLVLYVDSSDGKGTTGDGIDLAYWFDSDYWKNGTISGNPADLLEDQTPNVRCYFGDDDFITVIVVDVNRNITEW